MPLHGMRFLCSNLLESRRSPPRTRFPPGEIHELLEEAGTVHPAPLATRLGFGVHLSRVPEAFWRERENHRVFPSHRLATFRCLPHRRDLILLPGGSCARTPLAHPP